MKLLIRLFLTFGLAASLGACSGGGESAPEGKAKLSLRLTDAPIDMASRVVVQFTEVRLRKKDGGWQDFPLDAPQAIDLLQLHGTNTADLLSDIEVDAGDYDEIRLLVDPTPNTSFIELSVGGLTHPLVMPSGISSGLKLKGDFTLRSTRASNLTVDFDLRKSIVLTGAGTYRLKPVLRLVDDANAGHIRGMVDVSKLDNSLGNCSDADPLTYNALYVFDGSNVIPDDINQTSSSNVEPVTTTAIMFDTTSGSYMYEAAFLPAGNYTIAFTCRSDFEDVEADDDLMFFDIQNVTVLVNNTVFL